MSEGKEHTVMLGESLTTLLSILRGIVKPDVIIDIWEGGGTLYGWDTPTGGCIDRIPIFSNEPCSINEVDFKVIKPSVEVMGSEEGFEDKLNRYLSNAQVNWLDLMSRGGYIPLGGWCSIVRSLRGRVPTNRLYGELKYILVDERVLRVGWRTGVKYKSVVSTMPTPYILNKIITENAELKKLINKAEFTYASLYAVMLIARGGDEVDNVKVIKVGKKGFLTALITLMPLNEIYSLNNLTLVYVMAPLTLTTLKPELGSKLISEVRRLGISISIREVYMYRDYFERYAFLGNMNEYASNAMDILSKEYGFKFMGRLGLWREVGICELLNQLRH